MQISRLEDEKQHFSALGVITMRVWSVSMALMITINTNYGMWELCDRAGKRNELGIKMLYL